MKFTLLYLLILSSFISFGQKPDLQSTASEKSKSELKKETNINVKAGVTCNFLNKALYKKLNEGYQTDYYKAENISAFINPYVSIGLERYFTKKIGLQFHLGFYQTLQKYTTSTRPNTTYTTTNTSYRISSTEYLSNNVFLEILPTYKISNSRFFGGINITRSSPSVSTKVTITDLKTGETETLTEKDKPEESYHPYSTIGFMQSFPVKTFELTISASYFGIFKKYDSGFNLMLGILF